MPENLNVDDLVSAADHLLTPVSMLADGNERCEARGAAHTFPGGGIMAGLHATVFSMQSMPVGPQRSRANAAPITGPSPIDVLLRRGGRRQ